MENKTNESMWKQIQVVMLPTDEKATVGSIVTRPSDNRMAIVNILTKDDPQPCVYQHLYFLSDEQIKEGDWTIAGDNEIWKAKKGDVLEEEIHGKIIATTDKLSLSKPTTNNPLKYWNDLLPQPSQDFIKLFVEEYNKGQQITKVLVEYEEYQDVPFGIPVMKDRKSSVRLKVNANNEINIKPIKDSLKDLMKKNPELKEEVINLCFKAFLNYKLTFDKKWKQKDIENAIKPFNKWISENL